MQRMVCTAYGPPDVIRLRERGDKVGRSARSSSLLRDVKVDVKPKLSALWVALMFFYVYADILLFYRQGHVAGLIAGKAGGMDITPAFVLGSAIVMAIPSLMVFLPGVEGHSESLGEHRRRDCLCCCTGSHPLCGEDHR